MQPNHVEALHFLGVIAHQVGRSEIATEFIGRSIALDGSNPAAHANLAAALLANGRAEEAIAHLRRALQLKPDFVEAHYNLGKAWSERGQVDEAMASYRRALQFRADHADAHNNLGNLLKQRGDLDGAIQSYESAIRFQPGLANAHNNLGVALVKKERCDEAIAAYRRAIELKPDFVDAYNNLGCALREVNQLEDAASALRRALALQPDYAEVHNNLGNLFTDLGRCDEAEASYRRAQELKANYAEARFDQSMLWLLRGDFERGWAQYEARWEAFPSVQRHFSQPMWEGRSLEGSTILLHAEQGFGDTLHFVRYAPMVAARGGRVVVECQPPLKTLVESVAGVSQVIAHGDALPAFDWHCPLMSLPRVFATRVETIPGATPYLAAEATRIAQWRERLRKVVERGGEEMSLARRGAWKVGLVWAAGMRPEQQDFHRVQRLRSLSLRGLAPLGKVPGVIFVSLQKGPAAMEARTLPAGMTLFDWTEELHDFADTAALVEALDLVITVDTAVAHLAGALGKPVWLMNRFAACWRWMLQREDSPWYPTMRIFRQPKAGDWDSVAQRVAEDLERSVCYSASLVSM